MRLLFLLLATISIGLESTSSSARVPEVDEPWSLQLIVTPANSSQARAPADFWIGVTNRLPVAQAACVLSWGYALQDAHRGQSAAEGSSHACDVSESFQIILAGQTYFKKVKVPVFLTANDVRPLAIHVLLRHRGLADRAGGNATVEWHGTALEAFQAGKILSEK